ncbi:SDR family oxidoreductase [Streptomonospora sediminis]
MNLTLMGATGGLGRAFAQRACEAGHRVTALVRDPARMDYEHPNLTTARADVTDAGALAPLLAGRDAVVSALGHRGSGPATICATAARSTTAAMAEAGVARLVVVSAAGMFTDGDGPITRMVAKPILQRVLRENFADMHAMEATVRASGLDWTIVRPPQLLDKPYTGRYRTAVGTNVRGGIRIGRADTAACMLDCVEGAEPIADSIAPAY